MIRRRNTSILKAIIYLFLYLFLLIGSIAVLAQKGIIPLQFSPLHSLLKDKSFNLQKYYSFQHKTPKEEVGDSVLEDFKVAKQMGENIIIKDVKEYNLVEGITLEEKIKLIHPTDFDKLQWEISQFPDDFARYFISVYLPDNNKVKYLFVYNSVTYTVEATNADTNNLMTLPYQIPTEQK